VKISKNKGRNQGSISIMEPANQKKLQEHLKAIAGILYQEAKTEELESLAGIERTIRARTLEYITPELGVFFSKKQQELHREE
jgi:hypothetical protein